MKKCYTSNEIKSDLRDGMKRNKIVKGTLPPLFDRIITDRTGQGLESKLLSAQELKESIIREISTVLNTRCTVRKAIYKDHIDNIVSIHHIYLKRIRRL